MTDDEAKKLLRRVGVYSKEALQNYESSRKNGSSPQQAFEWVKEDLKKRGVRV